MSSVLLANPRHHKPKKKKGSKKHPSKAQRAARKRFAEMARSKSKSTKSKGRSRMAKKPKGKKTYRRSRRGGATVQLITAASSVVGGFTASSFLVNKLPDSWKPNDWAPIAMKAAIGFVGAFFLKRWIGRPAAIAFGAGGIAAGAVSAINKVQNANSDSSLAIAPGMTGYSDDQGPMLVEYAA